VQALLHIVITVSPEPNAVHPGWRKNDRHQPRSQSKLIEVHW